MFQFICDKLTSVIGVLQLSVCYSVLQPDWKQAACIIVPMNAVVIELHIFSSKQKQLVVPGY